MRLTSKNSFFRTAVWLLQMLKLRVPILAKYMQAFHVHVSWIVLSLCHCPPGLQWGEGVDGF